MDIEDLDILAMEMQKIKHIKPKQKINAGPTKAKLVEKNLGFNEGFNSAQYEVLQQTGQTTDQLMQKRLQQSTM